MDIYEILKSQGDPVIRGTTHYCAFCLLELDQVLTLNDNNNPGLLLVWGVRKGTTVEYTSILFLASLAFRRNESTRGLPEGGLSESH